MDVGYAFLSSCCKTLPISSNPDMAEHLRGGERRSQRWVTWSTPKSNPSRRVLPLVTRAEKPLQTGVGRGSVKTVPLRCCSDKRQANGSSAKTPLTGRSAE